ncbi:hypothetical protein niasHS_016752 [Heterodera schachtii]|uniref:Uncharacterized protein n=1 Tax=Heterodera schachtii TaxID=97005 RepID=A0ABD2HV73_HETSC
MSSAIWLKSENDETKRVYQPTVTDKEEAAEGSSGDDVGLKPKNGLFGGLMVIVGCIICSGISIHRKASMKPPLAHCANFPESGLKALHNYSRGHHFRHVHFAAILARLSIATIYTAIFGRCRDQPTAAKFLSFLEQFTLSPMFHIFANFRGQWHFKNCKQDPLSFACLLLQNCRTTVIGLSSLGNFW